MISREDSKYRHYCVHASNAPLIVVIAYWNMCQGFFNMIVIVVTPARQQCAKHHPNVKPAVYLRRLYVYMSARVRVLISVQECTLYVQTAIC